MIVVRPLAGLCNRMRVINSCIALQKRNLHARKIKLIWEKDALLNCDFVDLFQPISNIEIIDRNKALTYFLYYHCNYPLPFRSRMKKSLLKYRWKNFRYYNTDIISQLRFQNEYWENAKNNFIIDTYNDFYHAPNTDYFGLFKPVEPLQKLIQKEVDKFLKPTIGVHVRRTDNRISIEKSTTQLFIKTISDLLEKDNNQLFYLSTDDLETENQFKKKFGGYIINQNNKDFKRDTKSGIESAVIDLYALSETKNILGSYYSTFSDIAAKIKNIPLEIIV
jgi:hypothetical protein